MSTYTTSEAILSALTSSVEVDQDGGDANVVDALCAMSRGLHFIAQALEKLGTNGASGNLGAIELLALETQEGSKRIAESLDYLAQVIDRKEMP